MKIPLEAYFWPKVNKAGPIHPIHGQCWEWTACCNRAGYGKLTYNRKSLLAHQVSWFLMTGNWPEKYTLHKCDNPPCINPLHLFEGNDKDNVRDMIKKGRDHRTPCTGERNGGSILTLNEVMDIRNKRRNGVTNKALTEEYGMNRSTITNITTGKLWKTL